MLSHLANCNRAGGAVFDKRLAGRKAVMLESREARR